MGGILAKLFSKGATDLVEAVGNAIDKNVTSKEEKLQAKTEITTILTDYHVQALEIQKEVVLAEMNGNKYQRSWRPSLMYMAMFIIFSTWFLLPLINIWAQDPNLAEFVGSLKDATDFWDIIKLGVGAFGIGRTIEKATKDIVNNVDVGLKKKK